MVADSPQAEFWDRLSASWDDAEPALELVIGAPGEAALQHLDPQPGEQVLDVGCGTGGTTVALARRVAPDGRAVGLDISAEMVARAGRRSGLPPNAEFVRADAGRDPLGEAVYDAAFSRLGVMFFDDPVRAFTAVHRSLRPGGRLVFVCWQALADNELMSVQPAAVAAALGITPAPAPADAPGPFSLADPARIREVLGAAGFEGIDLVSHTEPATLPAEQLARLARHSLHGAAAGGVLDDRDAATRERVRSAVHDALMARVRGGYGTFTRAAWLVSARR